MTWWGLACAAHPAARKVPSAQGPEDQFTRSPISEGECHPSALPWAKPCLPWGDSLGLGQRCCSLGALARNGPQLILWDELRRKPSSEGPMSPLPTAEKVSQ